ncbi:MAG: FHA domain-containing protein [Candidatus Protochlamydia sp.]|nr:FHA domain-containing protein [Candidatus Protochlamydia sp.]
MIRLTINAQSDPEIHLFNKTTILLGSDLTAVDLGLKGQNIKPVHLKIGEQNGFLILINQANDPFVSLNGQPFGKKLLNSGDVILVHDNEILFENLGPLLKDEKSNAKFEEKFPSFETKENKTFLDVPLPFESEVEALCEDELKSSDLNKYLSSNSKVAEPVKEKKPLSLKDDYLRELDDDNQIKKEGFYFGGNEQGHLKQAWKWIALFIISILALAGLIGSIIYFTASDKAEAHETKAAQGVADVAMALTHAKLYRLKPHNENWSDVDFLKQNLQTILPDATSYANQLDVQGQLNCCLYSFRIYTNSDLSHFLIIAQPSPSWLHWLVPKSIIAVDSQAMELRNLKDIRHLNRLLANSNPLDGANGKEIAMLIKEGRLTTLASLAAESKQPDFSPPKNLALIRPGAENLIYNAPRYHHLSESLRNRILNLSAGKGNGQEVIALKQDVESFSRLNHFVLYAHQGKKSAFSTQEALLLFAPSNKMVIGYLGINEKGKIEIADLLNEEDINREREQVAYNSDPEKKAGNTEGREEGQPLSREESQLVDFNHPIYIQLQTLTMARESELAPIYTALTTLLNQEFQKPSLNFHGEFKKLSHQYLKKDAKHKQEIKEILDVLFHQYAEMPTNQFLAYVKQLRLEQIIEETDQPVALDENCIQNLENMLSSIGNAQTLAELGNPILIANSWLNFDYINNSHEIVKYENILRNHVLAQLEKLLLSNHSGISKDDRETLEAILSHERLIKKEEKDFFMAEFDALFPAKK